MFKNVKYIIRFYAEQVTSISEKQGHGGKHGAAHEVSSGDHHTGATHVPAIHHNAHHGHNHKKRVEGAHQVEAGSHHDEG